MYLITLLLRIEEMFSPLSTLTENPFVSEQWKEEGCHAAWDGGGVLYFGYQVSTALFQGDGNASVWGLRAN